MNAAACLLVIGDLGDAGALSLRSLEVVNSVRICVAANSVGKDWLLSTASNSIKDLLCFHPGVTENFEYKSLEIKREYSEYRSKDFRLLTLLKWDLLIDILYSHPDTEVVLFSDLDIYWMSDPHKHVSRLQASKSLMFVQNDSSDLRPLWCCTGVMFWKNTQDSIKFLRMLRERHQTRIASGNLQDDEDTFNQFVSESPCLLDFERLPADEFLVGRHFRKLLSTKDARDTPCCFHANYLTGLDRKFNSLNAVDQYIRNQKFPWVEMVKFMTIPKLKRIHNGARRRIRLK